MKQEIIATTRTVELLDLSPTLARLCGLTPPAGLEGRSLRSLPDTAQALRNKPAYTQVVLRTERWRYTGWDEGRKSVELYDHDKDPREYHNLAGDPAYAKTMKELKRLLHAPPTEKARK